MCDTNNTFKLEPPLCTAARFAEAFLGFCGADSNSAVATGGE